MEVSMSTEAETVHHRRTGSKPILRCVYAAPGRKMAAQLVWERTSPVEGLGQWNLIACLTGPRCISPLQAGLATRCCALAASGNARWEDESRPTYTGKAPGRLTDFLPSIYAALEWRKQGRRPRTRRPRGKMQCGSDYL